MHPVTPPLLTAAECRELAGLFVAGRFRSTVDMARHRFGDGRGEHADARSRTGLGVNFHDAR